MMIKILQGTTVAMFLVSVLAGLGILIWAPEKMQGYRDFLGAIWPLFVAEVIPALIGTPLKEFVQKLPGKNA